MSQQPEQPNNSYNQSAGSQSDSWQNLAPRGNEQQEFSQPDHVNLNTHIKSIVLNKQGDDGVDKCSPRENDERKYVDLSNKTNQNNQLKSNKSDNFLSHSHHPQNLDSSISMAERSFRDDLDRFLPPVSSSMSVLGNSPQGVNSTRDGGDFNWVDKDRLCCVYSENNNQGNWISDYEGLKKQDEPYKFAGDGGPAELKDLVGFSCCR